MGNVTYDSKKLLHQNDYFSGTEEYMMYTQLHVCDIVISIQNLGMGKVIRLYHITNSIRHNKRCSQLK